MEEAAGQVPAVQETEAARERVTPALRVLAGLRGLGAARLAVLGLAAAALLGTFAHLVLQVAQPHYTLLYADLELEDSAEITGRLEALAVPFRLRDDGATILVPADRALRLRLTLAEEGLPRGGSVGYEIFDQTSAFGTTSFLADVNLRRALEGELARTITALAGVKSARVHLVLPKRELFRREQIEPSASITLRMAGGRRLDRRQVAGVQHLVAAAVPGLAPERVTLVDGQGTLLARGGDGALDAVVPAQAEEYRAAYEARLKRTVEELLERSLGPGRVRAEVTAELDFDQVTTTEESFDPEGQVVRSTQTVEEDSSLAERDQDDAVTVGNNLPNAGADTPAAARTSSESTNRTEETINYEISRKVRNHTQAGGRVRRLSVAVLVDGRTVPDPSGALIYTPLEPAELERLGTLVRSAVGFDEARGDVIEVINMPFSEPPALELEERWLALGKEDLFRLLEILGLAVMALMLILLVVRPALRQLAPEPALAGALAGGGLALPPGAARPALAGPQKGTEPQLPARVDLDQVEGTVSADLVTIMGEAIERSPEEVVAILRNWLNER